SLRCSCTRRTARALTSGEYLFDLFMAPSSQIVEPPQNPGRFSVGGEALRGASLSRLEQSKFRASQRKIEIGTKSGHNDLK
ncbi:hypothetical protein, partial [Nitrosomonas eutropha]|uniref:hypothetical protein n=1 Tax=Nitrosomonas eutropha TaxID=916 RepID=UPI001C42EB41